MLGQGTTFGESQTMTLMITTGQSMQTPSLHSIPAAEPCFRPGGLPLCVRLFHQRAERERHRQRRHGHSRAFRQRPDDYGVSVP